MSEYCAGCSTRTTGMTSGLCRECLTDLADAPTLRARVAELEAKLEEAKRPHLCNVCVGKPLASGRQCICGGAGTEAAETQGLRAECFRLTDEVARLTTARAEMQARCAKECEYIAAGHRAMAQRAWDAEDRIYHAGAENVLGDMANIIRSLYLTPEPPHV